MPEPTQSPSGKLRPIHCFHCGANNFVAADLPPMTTMPCNKCGREIMIPYLLRNFEIRQTIASGGMGTVYRAFDTILKREVAVKLMKKELGRDQKVLDEFYKEARMIAALNHPNIIQVFNFGEMDGENFIAMELADRGSVESRAAQTGGKLPELQVLDVGIKIAGALAATLKQNLLHRDIKPANILFNADNEPKLVDFGLAREADKDVGYGEEVWGTPEYSAPEKFKREGETFRSDLYSLGCALYQALTGQLPFPGPSVEEMVRGHCEKPVVPPSEVFPEISAATSEAIVQSLAKKPRERFGTYEDFIMALTTARSQLLVAQANPGASKTPTRKGITSSLKKAEPAKASRPVPGRPAATTAAAPAGGNKKLVLIGSLVGIGIIAGAALFLLSKSKTEDSANNSATPVVTNMPAPAVATTAKPGEWIPLSIAALQTRWSTLDGKPVDAEWTGVGGVINYTGSSTGAIASLQDFDTFDLSFEWKVEANAKGSLFCALPRTPDGMKDALRFTLGQNNPRAGRFAPGALSGLLPANSNVVVKGGQEFNIGRLVAMTNHVEFWINGIKAVGLDVNSDRLSNAAKASNAPAVGPAFGTTTGGAVGFEVPAGFTLRDVKIRTITSWPKYLSVPSIKLNTLERPKVTGPLVNLSGDDAVDLWRPVRANGRPNPAVWKFESGFITCTKPKEGFTPAIRSLERFIDFELLLEWKTEKDGNGQIVFGLQDLPMESTQNAYRIAIGDSAGLGAKPEQAVGSLVGIVPSKSPILRPVGQFNSMRIVAFGERAEVWMNGAKCNEFDLADAAFKAKIPSTEYKDRPLFGKTLEGWIALNPSDGITIRAMRIRPISQIPQVITTAPVNTPAPAPKKKKK